MTPNDKSVIFGITGGSGSGKSYVSDIFRKNGFFIIDADKIGHQIIMPGKKAYFELIEHFGKKILTENGEIDRGTLGKIVFSDNNELKFLNSVTHPRICAEIYGQAGEKGGIVGADGALLIESGLKCRPIIAVIADKNVRAERIMRRDGISRESAESRINSQKDAAFYRSRCDYIIENNSAGSEGDIEDKIKKIIYELRENYGKK
ncbi:MAG: dephospho-CoA kinase [Oscillospiraceae bacterium]|nr:dephospho-CoA kinase [Oscillospiraceae bacterium]